MGNILLQSRLVGYWCMRTTFTIAYALLKPINKESFMQPQFGSVW